MHTQLASQNAIAGSPDAPRPQTIASEVAQGEINNTGEFIGELQAKLNDVTSAIQDHEQALSALATRRAMLIAALSQLEAEPTGMNMPMAQGVSIKNVG